MLNALTGIQPILQIPVPPTLSRVCMTFARYAQLKDVCGRPWILRRGVPHPPELARRARYGANAKAMTLTSAR